MNNLSLNQSIFDEFQTAYVEALLWASELNSNENEHADNFVTSDELDGSMKQDCLEFLETSFDVIAEAIKKYPHYTWARAGRDFALARNGQGEVDLYLGEQGKKITELSDEQGEVDLYLGDDDLLYSF